MITEIQIDPDFEAFEPEDLASLEKDIFSFFPYPLSLSYKNILETKDPLARLGVCMKDTLHTLLQYRALLMLHDYANSKMERSFDFICKRIGNDTKWIAPTFNKKTRTKTIPERVPGLCR